MPNVERVHPLPKPAARQSKLQWNVLLKDFRFFVSFCLAQLIVRRTLRRRHKERARRLKLMRLAQPGLNEELNKSVDKLGETQC